MCVAAIIPIAYAIPLVCALPLDRTIQKDSEVAVRTEVGRQLDQLMGKQDSVFSGRPGSSASRSGIA
jgi:hypothetical protein